MILRRNFSYILDLLGNEIKIDQIMNFNKVQGKQSSVIKTLDNSTIQEYYSSIINSKNPNMDIKTPNEYLFTGRSNVGKSSIINSLLESSLAQTSKQPVF